MRFHAMADIWLISALQLNLFLLRADVIIAQRPGNMQGMSGYGSMKASPFWKGVMHVTGILCLVTLMTPPAFYFKYLIFDSPGEAAAANAANSPTLPPLSFHYVQVEINRANSVSASDNSRIQAVTWLRSLVLSPNAQISHPVECMLAKSTLGTLAMTSNPAVKIAASDAITDVAEHGAVIER
jgi:hypothetical protein